VHQDGRIKVRQHGLSLFAQLAAEFRVQAEFRVISRQDSYFSIFWARQLHAATDEK
jgi:hypothetical protein